MKKIKIKETKQADSRTAQGNVTKETLLKESKLHIEAVSKVMAFMAQVIKARGEKHDHTKIEYIDEFYDNFIATRNGGVEFKELGWWKKHLEERHHLEDKAPEDVNLIDVLEMVCDSVCAGLARSGEVREVKIHGFTLDQAVTNTVKLLESIIEVEK